MTLESLGVSGAEQRVYEVLLRHPEVTFTRLAELTGMTAGRLRPLVASLAGKGMLTRTTGRPALIVASPPDIAVEILAQRRRAEIEQARLSGASFGARLRLEQGPVRQVIRDRGAAAQRYRQLHQVARTDLLVVRRSPDAVVPLETHRQLQREARARGVRTRTLYEEGEPTRPSAPHEPEAGEQARMLPAPPVRMVIADGRIGLVFAEPASGHQAVVVSSATVVSGLVALFDLLWERASPLWPENGRAGTGEEDQRLLVLLAAGLTDQAIGRKLGVAQRTVERRVRRLMDALGARTRFQAGLQAARRGLLEP
ncbi:helix-turn-helix domain-containing protein [Amycolatopsis sp. NPDC059021]|uniref:helix-turn-helix transcriptional regulator n=1 Tax=Amycolatopsis sp. NPDC059021 TaxID=3346704 RepID=UPI003670E440